MSVLQWECKAQTDKKYQLGRIQVSCEGYDYPDDPYILRGSCGVSEGVVVWLGMWVGRAGRAPTGKIGPLLVNPCFPLRAANGRGQTIYTGYGREHTELV